MSTKKGDHASKSTKKNASNLSKRSLEETTKSKTRIKPADVESLDKNLSKHKEEKVKNISTLDKKVIKVSNTLKKKAIPISTTKSMTNTLIDKKKEKAATIVLDKKNAVITNKKEKAVITTYNFNKSQNIDRKIKSDKTIDKKIDTNKISTSQSNLVLPEFNKSKDTVSDYIPIRPSTATLLEGTVKNVDKIGPDILNSPTVKSDVSDNYEDDFESYESDFENYSSSSSTNLIDLTANNSSLSSYSEELTSFEKNSTTVISGSEDDKNLDSGHFEMPGYKHKPMLDNIKEAIERENNTLLSPTHSASLSDEGFEDHKSFQFVNFIDAQLKTKRKRSIQLKQKRGEEILSMVRLDYFSFTLFDLAPITYEQYVKNFGTTNTIQTSIQTGDDDIDEEIQTDEINYNDKLTQQPEVFTNWYRNSDTEFNIKDIDKSVNKNSLNKFLLSACQIVLKIQEESNALQQNCPKEVPFSKSVANFKTDNSIFLDTHIRNILFPFKLNDKIITIHIKHEESFISQWNMSNSMEPNLILKCYGNITCCCFGIVKNELIFTGLEDGSILVWNGSSKLSNTDLIPCVPLFSTGLNSGHQSKIIGLHFLGNLSDDQWNIQQTNELCSIDEDGEIILWTIMLKYSECGKYKKNDKITLVKNATISLKKMCPDLSDLHCTHFCSSTSNPDYLFITTNYGIIIHYIIKAGINKVKRYSSEIQSFPKSLECCPFSPEYFLAGYENGNISLFSRSSDRPLIVLSEKDKEESSAIESIQWSKNKATVIYSKDNKNNINIWDLNESDMLPVYSISYKEEITAMKICSTSENTTNKISMMLIGTKSGNLHLHHLNEGQLTNDLYQQSIKTFFNYVKRL